MEKLFFMNNINRRERDFGSLPGSDCISFEFLQTNVCILMCKVI